MKTIIYNEKINIGEYQGKKINELILSCKVKKIGDFAFRKNEIAIVTIPDEIEYIGTNAFDLSTTIIYKKQIYNSFIIRLYGTENVIKIGKILETVPKILTLENITKYFTKKLLENFNVNNDNVKSYISNFNKFNICIMNLKKETDIIIEKELLYKLFYLFGYFNCNDKEKIYKNILAFLHSNNIYRLIEILDSLEIVDFNMKLAFILNEEGNNKQTLEVLYKVYDDFTLITKEILSKKTIQIQKINSDYKKTKDKDIKNKYKIQRKQKKQLTLDDLIYYINLKSYLEENSAFSSIAPILYRNVSKEEIDRMYSIYNKAKETRDNQYFQSFASEEGYTHFSWLRNTDLLNFTIGYFCDCCAKMGYDGEFIINNSMTNPIVKNLVIFDSTSEVLAKTTALYNPTAKTIIFNGVMMPKIFRKNKYVQSIVLEVIQTAIIEQITMMTSRGIEIQEVRMEGFDNHLKELLKDYPISSQPINNFLSDKVKEEQYVLYRK